jgi:hypothetical protein
MALNSIDALALASAMSIDLRLLGSSVGHGSAALGAFRHGWWVTAALSAASIVPAMTLLKEGQ